MKVMEQTVAYLSIIGALMVSNQYQWGWVAYLVASTTGIVWSYKKKYNHLLIMNIFFTIANFCGIWNYLIQKPEGPICESCNPVIEQQAQ